MTPGSDDDELARLRVTVAQLARQAAALADANAAAAELMSELDAARMVEAALLRRAEEMEVQQAIDRVLLACSSPEELAAATLRALVDAAPLSLAADAAFYAVESGSLKVMATVGSIDAVAQRRAACAATLADERSTGACSESGEVVVVLRTRGLRLGCLCLRGRAGAAWRERWLGLLCSFGAQIGGTLERLRIAAQNEELIAALEVARDRALDASRAKDRFLATMSHELRTPLNAILGYSELLLEEADELRSEGSARDLRRILGAGRHLLGLIDDLLDLAKIEVDMIELSCTAVAVAALLEEIGAMVAPWVEASGNSLTIVCAPAVGVAWVDETRLRQVLLNLLSNACKFTHGGAITVSAARAAEADAVVFVVADEGIGMSESMVSAMFEPFVQGDTSSTRRYGGSGLGLTICQRFVAMMGGVIHVSSALGRGTTFEVRLPARAPGPR
ncbi:MAG: hypothetical protein IPK80_06600 [Nannocystis sp.]|nr:hypothetical protein [Nannocystis sp.]